MMEKSVYLVFGMFLLVVAAVGFASSQGISYCCERLKDGGAWCQNAEQSECASDLRSVPTSCDFTSYCKLGTCINADDGICMTNTPRVTCERDGGEWVDKKRGEVPQCNLGCCLIGDQAAFVTKARCFRLASDYGIETNFREDITSESLCIASSTPEVEGACVYQGEYGKTCEFVAKADCQERLDGEFYKDLLCSNRDLGTNCAPTKETTCADGKDEVYFVDSCGNLANVYDANMIEPTTLVAWDYWSKVQPPTCDVSDYAGCGNCDYLGGSVCESEADTDRKATYGDWVCRDLGCSFNGQSFNHGETWCGVATDDEAVNRPGGRHFRYLCYDGDIIIEPCADYRAEVCIGDAFDVAQNDEFFGASACRVNRWQDCYSQSVQAECEDSSVRDCKWADGVSLRKDNVTGLGLVVEGGELVAREVNSEGKPDSSDTRTGASCVPKYAPGFDFWQDGDGPEICSIVNTQCYVTYTKKGLDFLGGDNAWEINTEKTPVVCIDDDGNVKEEWAEELNNLCVAVGDCGVKLNYKDGEGKLTNKQLVQVLGELGDGKTDSSGGDADGS